MALRDEADLAMVAVPLTALLPPGRALWEGYALQPPPGLRLAYRFADELLLDVVAIPDR